MQLTTNFEFPLYLKDVKNNEYFKYTDGNTVLQCNLNCIHTHCAPYIMNTKEEFISFLNVYFARTEIVQISENEFNSEFWDCLNYILKFGNNPKDYWDRTLINNNNKFLKKTT